MIKEMKRNVVVSVHFDICVLSIIMSSNALYSFICLFQVFNKLLRRYKYLEKSFEESIKKVRYQLQ